MTGKQLIILALLISANYIYFSFQHINQELLNDKHNNAPISNLNENNNLKTTTKILNQIDAKEIIVPHINIEEKVIEVIEAVQSEKIVSQQPKEIPVQKQVVSQPIEKKINNNLESEIEAALKEISTSQSIDK